MRILQFKSALKQSLIRKSFISPLIKNNARTLNTSGNDHK